MCMSCNQKIYEYKLITSENVEHFNTVINELIKQDFVLYGVTQIVTVPSPYHSSQTIPLYTQALIHY